MTAVIVLLAVLLTGCQFAAPPTASESAATSRAIRYFKDSRTGLCFAEVQSIVQLNEIVSIASVPCSPEVMGLIGRAQ
jgi:hypothetical protein